MAVGKTLSHQLWDILIISLWRFLEQWEIFLKHCTKVSEPCVCSFRIKHISLWGLTSHETLPLSIFISYETSCCEILRHTRHISLRDFNSNETHSVVSSHFPREKFGSGISLHAKDMYLQVSTSVQLTKIFLDGAFNYYVSTQRRRGVHQNASVCDLSDIIFFT